MAALERKRSRLGYDLAGAGADHAALAAFGSELAAVEAEIESVEQRWLALVEEAEGD